MNFSDALGGIGTALDTPRRLLYQGGTALARAGGYEGPDIDHFADLLGQAGMDQDSWLTKGLGFAGDLATDPMMWAGGAALKGVGKLAGLGAADTGAMTGLRRGFAFAHDVDPATGVAGKILGGSAEAKGTAEAAGHLLASDPATAGVQGLMFHGENAGAGLAGTGANVGRHEITHGMVDQIAQGASSEGAPALVKAAGLLKRGDTGSGLRSGLGQLADEAAAFTLQNRGGGAAAPR